MTGNMRLAAWGFGLLAMALAVVFGPLIAGYVFAGVALALMIGLMGMGFGRAIGDWCLEHPCPFHYRSAGVRPDVHDERRAA